MCHGEEEMTRKPGVPAALPVAPGFCCPWREVKTSSPGISVDKNTDERDLAAKGIRRVDFESLFRELNDPGREFSAIDMSAAF